MQDIWTLEKHWAWSGIVHSDLGQVRIQGGPQGPGPPLTPGFEAPKLSFVGPSLIFLFFLASLRSAYNFFLIFIIQILKFFSLASLSIFLNQCKLKVGVLAHIGVPTVAFSYIFNFL